MARVGLQHQRHGGGYVAIYNLDIPVLMLPMCRLYIWPCKHTNNTNYIVKII